MNDPLGEIREAIISAVKEVSPVPIEEVPLSRTPPGHEGHLGTPIGFKLAKKLGMSPEEVAERIASEMKLPSGVKRVTVMRGFINFEVDRDLLFRRVLELAIREELGRGGFFGRVIVEHTSANPVHPLHVGSGRNAVIGDTLARMLSYMGFDVDRRYLVNDSGLQMAYLVLGSTFSPPAPSDVKKDHWYGIIYASSNMAVMLREGKNVEEVRVNLEKLRSKNRELVDSVVEGVSKMDDPSAKLQELIRRYQSGDGEISHMFRRCAEEVLLGFKETLSRLGVIHDAFDWESDLIWSGLVRRTVERLSRYIGEEEGALYLDLHKAAEDNDVVLKVFGFSSLEKFKQSVPQKFFLTRSDGTWLYTATDIAYSCYKLEELKFDRCYNVVGAEQKVEQNQVRSSMALMGIDPDRLVHFSYEIVELTSGRMRGRMGTYLTLDELVDATKRRVEDLLRGRGMSDSEISEISDKVAVGAIRYALLAVDPNKVVRFDWSRVLNLNENSGPFIQYSYTRATSILRKAGSMPTSFNPSNLEEELEEELIFKIAEMPSIMRSSVDLMRPDMLIQHANEMALLFNRYYEKYPVLKAEDGVKEARMFLVAAFKGALGILMDLTGIPRLDRM